MNRVSQFKPHLLNVLCAEVARIARGLALHYLLRQRHRRHALQCLEQRLKAEEAGGHLTEGKGGRGEEGGVEKGLS